MVNLVRLDDATAKQLEDKCQENGWLRIGGYGWQDDPYLEEYPYEFGVAGSLEELRTFALHGNWAIRQGVVYEDLAFVQQVDGGDEFWTLKRDGAGWTAFESLSLGLMAEDSVYFNRMVTAMHCATPAACRRLEYLDDVSAIGNAAQTARVASNHLNESPTPFMPANREQGR